MPEPTETSSPALDQVNQAFHDAYEAERDIEREQTPVLVVLADTLSLLFEGSRRAIRFSPDLFHIIKSVVHAPVAAFAAASSPDRLGRLRTHLVASQRQLGATADEPEVVARLLDVLERTLGFVEAALVHAPSRAELEKFARALGPLLLASTDDATRLQLDALDHAASELIGALSPALRGSLQVVVAGAHQARARSLGMQYFGALLGPRAERQLAYAESVETEEEALQLVGTRRVDRIIASAFFGEATRLERDVLGDSVKERLRDYEMRAAPLMP